MPEESAVDAEENTMAPRRSSEAGPTWPGWDDVIEMRYKMCLAKEGEDAFVAWLNDQVYPRSFGPNVEIAIACKLRALDFPYVFPYRDVLLCLSSSKDPKKYDRRRETQISKAVRQLGFSVYVPTLHLDGKTSAPGAVPRDHPANTIVAAITKIRHGAEMAAALDTIDADQKLNRQMRRQLGNYFKYALRDMDTLSDLLKEN